VLSEVFGFHPLAIRDCVERNHVAKVHAYPDHVFVVLHAPERGQGGHVHYLELDQFIGPSYLVTVHGPLNPVVDPELALRETRAVLRRVEAGRLRPSSSYELSHAIVSALTRHQEAFVASLAREGRDRGHHPADHRHLLGLWDEHHRQRPYRLPSPGGGAGGHDGHLGHPAALGQAPRLVVTATPVVRTGAHPGRRRLWLLLLAGSVLRRSRSGPAGRRPPTHRG
jgi:hypothetical protein